MTATPHKQTRPSAPASPPPPDFGPPPGHPSAPPEVGTVAEGSALSPRLASTPPAISTAAVAAAAAARAQIEARYHMALLHPRDFDTSVKRLYQACERPGFADEAMYARPVGKKKVKTDKGERWEDQHAEGLSIRFAEEAARMWGNLYVKSEVVHDDDQTRILAVSVTDLEVNLTFAFDVPVEKSVERRSLKRGQKAISSRVNSFGDQVHRVEATDDDVLMKANNLASKALRTGVLRLIPADVQEECKRRVQLTLRRALKEAGAIPKLLEAFAALDIAKDQLEGYLGHPIAEVTPQEYAELRRIGQGIKDEELSWEDVVATVPATSGRARKNVRGTGYEGEPAEVKREEIDMSQKPDARTARPPGGGRDDYGDEEIQAVGRFGGESLEDYRARMDAEIDREIVEREGQA